MPSWATETGPAMLALPQTGGPSVGVDIDIALSPDTPDVVMEDTIAPPDNSATTSTGPLIDVPREIAKTAPTAMITAVHSVTPPDTPPGDSDLGLSRSAIAASGTEGGSAQNAPDTAHPSSNGEATSTVPNTIHHGNISHEIARQMLAQIQRGGRLTSADAAELIGSDITGSQQTAENPNTSTVNPMAAMTSLLTPLPHSHSASQSPALPLTTSALRQSNSFPQMTTTQTIGTNGSATNGSLPPTPVIQQVPASNLPLAQQPRSASGSGAGSDFLAISSDLPQVRQVTRRFRESLPEDMRQQAVFSPALLHSHFPRVIAQMQREIIKTGNDPVKAHSAIERVRDLNVAREYLQAKVPNLQLPPAIILETGPGSIPQQLDGNSPVQQVQATTLPSPIQPSQPRQIPTQYPQYVQPTNSFIPNHITPGPHQQWQLLGPLPPQAIATQMPIPVQPLRQNSGSAGQQPPQIVRDVSGTSRQQSLLQLPSQQEPHKNFARAEFSWQDKANDISLTMQKVWDDTMHAHQAYRYEVESAHQAELQFLRARFNAELAESQKALANVQQQMQLHRTQHNQLLQIHSQSHNSQKMELHRANARVQELEEYEAGSKLLRETLDNTQTRLQEVQREYDGVKTSRKSLIEDLAKAKLAMADKEVMEERLKSKEDELVDARNKIGSLQTELNSLKAEIARVEKYGEAVDAASLREVNEGQEAEIQDLREKLKKRTEKLSQLEQESQAKIEELKKASTESVKKLGKEHADKSRDLSRENTKLKADLASKDSSFAGERQRFMEQISALQAVIDSTDSDDEISALKAEKLALEMSLGEKDAALKQATLDIDELRKAQDSHSATVSDLESQVSIKAKALESAESNTQALVDKIKRLKELHDLAQSANEVKKKEQLELVERNKVFEEELKKATLEADTQRISKLEAQVGQLEKENKDLRNKVDSSSENDKQLADLKKERDFLYYQSENLRKQIEKASLDERDVQQMRSQILDLKKGLESAENDRSKFEQLVSKRDVEKLQSVKKISDLEDEIRNLRRRLERQQSQSPRTSRPPATIANGTAGSSRPAPMPSTPLFLPGDDEQNEGPVENAASQRAAKRLRRDEAAPNGTIAPVMPSMSPPVSRSREATEDLPSIDEDWVQKSLNLCISTATDQKKPVCKLCFVEQKKKNLGETLEQQPPLVEDPNDLDRIVTHVMRHELTLRRLRAKRIQQGKEKAN